MTRYTSTFSRLQDTRLCCLANHIYLTGHDVYGSFPPARCVLAFTGLAIAFVFAPTQSTAQTVFPCGGGPKEQQIGMDTNGPAPVAICIERPTTGQEGEPAGSSGRTVYLPPPGTPPPRGWKQVYGAWNSFEIEAVPGTDRYKFDYVVSLGHATPEEALAAVRDACVARRPLFLESSPSTCDGYVIRNPFVQIIHYPDNGGFGNQAGTYFANTSTMPNPPGMVERATGRWDYCSERIRPEGECAIVVAYLENGEIPVRNRQK